MGRGRIRGLAVSDVRFPTSLAHHGSDAMHPDPDYSAAYVVIETDAPDGLKGCGFTFTLGKGTEVVISAVHALSIHIINKDLDDIISDFRGFYRQLTSDGQLRWIGPEKGAVHLATAAILNAIWDLWAKQEGKFKAGALYDVVDALSGTVYYASPRDWINNVSIAGLWIGLLYV